MEQKVGHRGTERILDILELISTYPQGYTLTEICHGIHAPKSSIFPLVHSLAERKFLSLDTATGKYTIGSAAFQVGSGYLSQFNLLQEIQQVMQQIVKQCRETCFCSTLNEGQVLYLLKEDSPESIVMKARVGNTLPAYSTGIGKALLMDHTYDDLKTIYPFHLPPVTQKTLKTLHELYDQLQTFRRDDTAYEMEESTEHVRCVAVPVRKNGVIRFALSVAVPVFRYSEEKEGLICRLLHEARQKLEAAIVHVPVQFR